MLFNSYEFLFFFLPFVFTTYRLLINRRAALEPLLFWLCLASLFFYAWWKPAYLVLLGSSLLGNYTIARLLSRDFSSQLRKVCLALGVVFNLALLAYYKYTGFLLENLQTIGYWQGTIPNIILPLAISFFTFQQIAYLVTCYKVPTSTCSLLEHVFFITFFPHLIAGPIVYKNELIDQVRAGKLVASTSRHWQQGITLFILGLSKKLLIGDSLAQLINPLYDNGGPTGSFDAWIGSLFFGFQIYFDFSAYSDMALGAAYLFGLKLPINFDSPYKATSYREFWRRWHITLFRFFRDHIYIPLNKQNASLAYKALLSFLIFFLSGIWHGAAWTFVIWGIANWVLIILNDVWLLFWQRFSKGKFPQSSIIFGRLYVCIAMSLTFMLFRSPDFATAHIFLENLFTSPSLANSQIIEALSQFTFFELLAPTRQACAALLVAMAMLLLLTVWYLPGAVHYALSDEYGNDGPRLATHSASAVAIGVVAWLCIMALPKSTEFLYFQF